MKLRHDSARTTRLTLSGVAQGKFTRQDIIVGFLAFLHRKRKALCAVLLCNSVKTLLHTTKIYTINSK